jgi:SsrA-binding protein
MSSKTKTKDVQESRRVIARNKRARFDYEVLERIEAGLVLVGTEVKSLREGNASILGAFVRIESGVPMLIGSQIQEYSHGNWMNHDPDRKRELLLHKREIRRLYDTIRQQGLTVVALELYFRGPRAKVEIALVRGRKHHDKRQMLAKKEARRDIERSTRRRR